MRLFDMTPAHVTALADTRIEELRKMEETESDPDRKAKLNFWIGAWGATRDVSLTAKDITSFGNRALSVILGALTSRDYDAVLQRVTDAQEAAKRAS